MIYIVVLTRSGKVKKMDYRDVRGELSEIPLTHRGSRGIRIAPTIQKATLVHPGSRALLFTEEGYCSVTDPNGPRPMGAMAEGIKGMTGGRIVDILEDPWTPMEIETIEKGGSE